MCVSTNESKFIFNEVQSQIFIDKRGFEYGRLQQHSAKDY